MVELLLELKVKKKYPLFSSQGRSVSLLNDLLPFLSATALKSKNLEGNHPKKNMKYMKTMTVNLRCHTLLPSGQLSHEEEEGVG